MYDLHLIQPKVYNEILERLEKLSASSQSQWGRMNVSQMLAHVALVLEEAMSDKKATQTLMGRIFGSGMKRKTLLQGFPKNIPTDAHLKITDPREFHREQAQVKELLEQFFQGGETVITRQPHTFFGRMTAIEWSRLQYLHVDHHFRQFGA
jgi:Protein of unknown function (DUF1569)